jgi:hypothetical protein
MFPIKNFSDIVEFMNSDQRFNHAPFNTIILYKTDHTEFRQHILEQFERIHHQTQNISCIIVDTPPINWTEKEDYQDYLETVGNDYQPVLNDFEVEMICKYMDISAESLPCVVCFNDIKQYNFNCFSFSNVDMTIVKAFFDSFLEKTAMHSYQKKYFVNTMIQLRTEFPDCQTFMGWDQSNPIVTRLRNALDDIDFYRSVEGQSIEQKKPRKLTPLQIVKNCCREVARLFWADNPDMTISAIIHSEEFQECFDGSGVDTRTDRTLRSWISEIEHNDKPGRRPGT